MRSRSSEIVRASTVNIAGNIVLSAFKMAIGLISNSIAITLDAVNNLTDVLSSVVAIGGAKLADRHANSKHPFGYGRMEHIASVAIAAIVIAAGITSFLEAVQAILDPPKLDYSVLMLAIVSVGCAVKIGLGLYLQRIGHRVNSDALVGSGVDAMMDSIVSATTIVAAIVYLSFGVSIEAWLGVGIALLITRAGLDLLFTTVSKLLGERVDPKVISQVEKAAGEVEGVEFVSGVVLQDFGPERLHGSLYVTVDGTMSVSQLDRVARAVQQRVAEQCGVKLISVGAYPLGGKDSDEHQARAEIGRIVWMHDDIVELRGLFVDVEKRLARFDAVAGFGCKEVSDLRGELVSECESALPGWTIEARILADI